MERARWESIQAVFDEALAAAPEARAALLDARCGEDASLRAEVLQLLSAHEDSGEFLERTPARIGPYRLVEPVGQGGMGTVYRAQRDDPAHEVAIKLLNLPPMLEPDRRFVDERRILARLSHPNIAHFLDGGVTPAGTPYLVMEFVRGERIDDYCRARPMGERLRLFREVCGAVQYAHQNLVVHRDLKPANVLVTPEGVPKLLDFGVAKILGGGETDPARTMAPLTLRYASPEQKRGDGVTTQSDVYSLGVLLDEIVGADPARDLAAILAKASRPEPGERYESAAALSADIESYLARRPVVARRGAAWYVFSRFVSRNRAAVAAGTAVVLTIAAGLGVIARQSRIVERRSAEIRRLAGTTIFQIHDAVAKLPGSTPARKLIVSNALSYLDRLAADASDDAGLAMDLAHAYRRLGDVQGLQAGANLGEPVAAGESFRKARALFAEVRRSRPRDVEAALGEIDSGRRLALVMSFLRHPEEARAIAAEAVRGADRLAAESPSAETKRAYASALGTLGEFSEEPAPRRRVAEIREELLRAKPSDRVLQREAALAHKYLAGLLLDRGEDAATELRRAEELDAARVRSDPSDREARLDLSYDFSQNATAALNRERFGEALEGFEKAARIRRELAALDPADIRLRDRLAYVHGMRAEVLLRLKRHAEAAAAFGESLELRRGLTAPGYRSGVAASLAGLGLAHAASADRRACGELTEALAMYRELESKAPLDEDQQERRARVEAARTRFCAK